MPTLKRSVVVKLMEAVGFDTASALSTGRLEKKVNQLGRLNLKDELEDREQEDMLEFVLEAINTNERIIIEDDRPDVPKYEQTQRTTMRGVPKKFDSKKSKYDWNTIFSGKIVALEQGTDYVCKSSTFALQVRAAAKRRQCNVKVSTRQGQVIVQAVK